jgi:membrane protein
MRTRPRSGAPSSRKGVGIKGIIEVVERVAASYFEHRMATYAAALAYRGLFGLFPFILLLVALVGIFASPDAFGQLVSEIKSQASEQIPKQLEPLIEQGREQIKPLEDMTMRAQKQLDGELLVVGVVVALWSVSAFASTLADAFNTVYGFTERRSWWKAQALSVATGPIVAVVVIVALVSLVLGNRVIESVAEALGLRAVSILLLAWVHYPVMLAVLWAALSFVYRYSPAVTLPLRSVMPGAALAVVAWAIASVGFSIYLSTFADYGVTYGSVGAAVGLLIYLNLSASIILAGAELNAALHPSAADPQGERADEPGAAGNPENRAKA